MTTEQLQFIFSLFSFVGVIGILFYIILERAKREGQDALVERLRAEVISLKQSVPQSEEDEEEKEGTQKVESEKEEPVVDNMKEKIIALYEEGADVMLVSNALNVPQATVEMVLKFHHLNKSDNWRESVDNDL